MLTRSSKNAQRRRERALQRTGRGYVHEADHGSAGLHAEPVSLQVSVCTHTQKLQNERPAFHHYFCFLKEEDFYHRISFLFRKNFCIYLCYRTEAGLTFGHDSVQDGPQFSS